jgi:hypothetical protein
VIVTLMILRYAYDVFIKHWYQYLR